MAFLSKNLLSNLSAEPQHVPYPELVAEELLSPEYIRSIHENQLVKYFKRLANSICREHQHQKPGDKPIVHAFHPEAFHYYRYGNQHFLSSHMNSLVGSPEKAEQYYLSRFQEAFPDFRIQFRRISNESYEYQISILI